MIQITNCPITGLTRKVEYDFLILKTSKQIIIACTVYYIDSEGKIVNKNGITPYKIDLVASDSKVNEQGVLDENGTITEFDYYNQMGNMEVSVYSQISDIIALRDSQGKFN